MKPKDVLQPCPFCGLHVELVSAKTYPNGERSPAYIKCKRCNYHIAGYEDKDVINQWNTRSAIRKEFCPNCEAETPCTHEAELYVCDICGEDFAKYIVLRNCNVSNVSTTQDVTTPEPPEAQQ
jgi:Lar family restriction alleviation protein